MERRNFLKYATATAALPFLFQGQWVKAVASNNALSLSGALNTNRKLVLVQLDGGNDGLNMVIPLTEYDHLANARGNILLPLDQFLKLTDATGLHPSMPELQSLFLNGQVQIVQGVGYPTPNYSHFRSKDIVLSGSDSNVIMNTGWLGRMLSTAYPGYPDGYPNTNQPHPIALTIGATGSASCQGTTGNYSSVLSSLNASYTAGNVSTIPTDTYYGKELSYISHIMEQTGSYMSAIKTAAAGAKNLSTLYPTAGQNSLADQLKIVANLIAGGLQTQIYIVSLGGWDTHSGQVNSADKMTGSHPILMAKLSKAIAAFQDDLKLLNRADEVMGLVYTEFGRRIKSNDSQGTDHGTTWPAIVFGTQVNPGITGQNPVIPALAMVSDNLPLQTDVRSIYSALYTQWMEVPAGDVTQIFGKSFPDIQLVSPTVGTPTTASPSPDLKLWPNPVIGTAQCSFVSKGESIRICIYSMNGQLVGQRSEQPYPQGPQQVELQLGHLPTGRYQLVVEEKKVRQSVGFVKR